ncbi:MAG TPA: hypothetical protein VHX20_04885 [Terracidiphilus sp.]|jgi:hypothetical protein|nr:hypothetical protein [Terracidiphilus sp.]
MSDPKRTDLKGTELEPTELQPTELAHSVQGDEEPSSGPNLVLLYSLIALALLLAIFLAGLIVLPFYRRR